MITITHKDSKIVAKITDGNGYEWIFEHNMTHQAEAKICATHFATELSERIQKIRQEAYKEGHRRAKAKERKMAHFSSNMDYKIVGW